MKQFFGVKRIDEVYSSSQLGKRFKKMLAKDKNTLEDKDSQGNQNAFAQLLKQALGNSSYEDDLFEVSNRPMRAVSTEFSSQYPFNGEGSVVEFSFNLEEVSRIVTAMEYGLERNQCIKYSHDVFIDFISRLYLAGVNVVVEIPLFMMYDLLRHERLSTPRATAVIILDLGSNVDFAEYIYSCYTSEFERVKYPQINSLLSIDCHRFTFTDIIAKMDDKIRSKFNQLLASFKQVDIIRNPNYNSLNPLSSQFAGSEIKEVDFTKSFDKDYHALNIPIQIRALAELRIGKDQKVNEIIRKHAINQYRKNQGEIK